MNNHFPERAVILCEGGALSVDETWLKHESPAACGPAVPLVIALVEREKEMIETALADCGGRIAGPSGAAAKLGIPRQTLESKIKSLGIDKPQMSETTTYSEPFSRSEILTPQQWLLY
jgi:formate hydrogenlyase transcriptional activator